MKIEKVKKKKERDVWRIDVSEDQKEDQKEDKKSRD
jgi:hypothetical protein